MSERASDFEALIDDAEDRLERLADTVDDVDDLDALDPDDREVVSADLDRLLTVVEKAGDLLETIDLTELPEAVDVQELLAAINAGEIPDAIESGETDDLVDLRAAIRAINLTSLFDLGNMFAITTAASDLDDAIEDVTESEGLVGDVLDGDDEDVDGMIESIVEEGMELAADGTEIASEELGTFDLGGGSAGLDAAETEAYQRLIQQQAIRGIDSFRAAILETHAKFAALYEYNRDHLGRTDKETTSRSPTAVSTLPLERPDVPSVSNHSTVPQAVQYSTAPRRRRIYGQRFEQELERKREQESNQGTQ